MGRYSKGRGSDIKGELSFVIEGEFLLLFFVFPLLWTCFHFQSQHCANHTSTHPQTKSYNQSQLYEYLNVPKGMMVMTK